jgi:hypothetical protein
MIDGNGRISRFLINDILRRDGALAAPYIAPISAILQRPDLRPLSYDGALELLSRPLMQQYRGLWSFGPEQQGQDGVTYNFQFEGYQDALHAWRYPDLTRHVTFLADALDLTIEQEMRSEAQYLQRHGAARSRLKTIVEGPDPALDRIIDRYANRTARSAENCGRSIRSRAPRDRRGCGSRNTRGVSLEYGE